MPTMTRDFKVAAVSSAIYAATEIYLGKKYPLKEEVSLGTRMAFAGGIAFLCVTLAEKMIPPDDITPVVAGRITR